MGRCETCEMIELHTAVDRELAAMTQWYGNEKCSRYDGDFDGYLENAIASDMIPAVLVMPLIEGKTLENTINDCVRTNQSIGDVISFPKMLKSLKCQLRRLHGAKLTHRDLKNDNVILMTNGSLEFIDFGVAGSTRPPKDASALHLSVTPYAKQIESKHMSPMYLVESWNVPRRYRARWLDTWRFSDCDSWQVGLIVYSMVMEKHLFTDWAEAIRACTTNWSNPKLDEFPGRRAEDIFSAEDSSWLEFAEKT